MYECVTARMCVCVCVFVCVCVGVCECVCVGVCQCVCVCVYMCVSGINWGGCILERPVAVGLPAECCGFNPPETSVYLEASLSMMSYLLINQANAKKHIHCKSIWLLSWLLPHTIDILTRYRLSCAVQLNEGLVSSR